VNGSGFGTSPYRVSISGANRISTRRPTLAITTSPANGRQRGDGRRPSGNRYASASGHRNSTGHSNATTAAQAPIAELRSSCSVSVARPSAAITLATDSGPSSRIHAIRFSGCRSATKSPTDVGARIAPRNGTTAGAVSEPSAEARSNTTAVMAAAAERAAITQASGRSALDIVADGLASEAPRPECWH
jgi:hypothetical protein